MTQNEISVREKGRALFLTAMMVLSVVAMTASFAGAAAAYNVGDSSDVNSGEAEINSGDAVWQGQTAIITESSQSDDSGAVSFDDATVELEDDNGDWLRDLDVEDGEVEVNTDNLETGTYNVTVNNAGTAGDDYIVTFELRTHGVTGEFADSTVTNVEGSSSAMTELEIDSDRGDVQTNVSASGLDADDLASIFSDYDSASELEDANPDNNIVYIDTDDDEIVLDGREAFEANFSNIEAGDYEFSIETSDTTAEDTANITVTDEEIAADLVESDINVEQGDLAEIPVELENTNEAYLKVGDVDSSGFESLVHIEDTSDDGLDQITLNYNTFIAGQGDEDAAWSAEEDDVEVTSENVEGELSEPLAATEYELSIGTGINSDGDDIQSETDTAFLNVGEYDGPSDVTTHTVPEDDLGSLSDLDDLNETTVTETNEFAHQDGVIVAIEDYGLSGALDDGELADSISIQIEEEDVPNQEPNPTDLTEYGEFLNSGDDAEYDGTLYFALDLANSDLYDESDLDAGFDVTVEADDSAFFLEEDEEIDLEHTISISERSVEWDDSAESAPAIDGAELSGETNVAPGTELNTQARSVGNFTQSPEAVVEEDGTFTATYNFGDYEPGTEFTLRVMDPASDAEHEIDSELVDAEEPNIELDTDAPSEVTVGENGTLDVTVSNTGGSASDEIEVGVVIGGENTFNDNITLDAGEEWSNSFDFTAEEAGDVEWSVTAGDNEETGTTTFAEEGSDDGNESDSGSDTGSDDESDSGSDSGSDDGDSGSDDGGEDDGSDDGTPGFGVAVALAALLGAAMLALRKQN
ncbi:BGTF surface domain-containing protein [Natrialba sp. PRR66]|uniref:BGTF surface domain-containing protein n=1 Tax=Natrialba sp. PRR66 TaxID=3098146 RepID=UPI002B1DA2E1|nr:BGTF surface domain-containing protein [Natrialba sp. PRR66]